MLDTLRSVNNEVLDQISQAKKLRKTDELFLLFAMGSQFDHLIYQEVSKLGLYCLVADPASLSAEDVKRLNPTGIILSGGPASVHQAAPPFDTAIFDLQIPVLGICLGFQLWARHIGVPVLPANKREFGVHEFRVLDLESPLFKGLGEELAVLESHGDRIEFNDRLTLLGSTENAPIAAANYQNLWGVQFHPEVTDTPQGAEILSNFCFGVCGAENVFPAEDEALKKVEALREQIGSKKVLLALSGGSDSSVVAYLLKHALAGKGRVQVRGVYIKGIDRPDDEAHVHEFFGNEDWLELKVVNVTENFLRALKGQITMKDKRVAMRGVYKQVLEEQAADFGADFIAQGTLYTDISESGGGYHSGAAKAQIKLHHNTNLGFDLPELMPIADCVKDNARNIGWSLQVPEVLLQRHPFPGPGLVVRIIGEVTADKLAIARQLDSIFIEELRKFGLYAGVWQAGVTLTETETTCTKGDDAVSGFVPVVWAVWSVNGFTAQSAELPWDFLKAVDQRMTNEIREIGATAYRLSGKPPSTIEMG